MAEQYESARLPAQLELYPIFPGHSLPPPPHIAELGLDTSLCSCEGAGKVLALYMRNYAAGIEDLANNQ